MSAWRKATTDAIAQPKRASALRQNAEPAVRPGQGRKVSDQRRAYANMMSKSKENVGIILRSVSLYEARTVQEKTDEYASFLLKKTDGGDGQKNPARPSAKGVGRRKRTREENLLPTGGTSGRKKNDSSVKAGNPEGRDESTRREKRFKDCIGAESRKRRKRTSSGGD